MKKIIRTICLFADTVTEQEVSQLDELAHLLERHQYTIQTRRICLSCYPSELDEQLVEDHKLMIGLGAHSRESVASILPHFLTTKNCDLTLDLTHGDISSNDLAPLFTLLELRPALTFAFAIGFNIPVSSPFFPTATMGSRGFSIGLQATDLGENCRTLEEWFAAMKTTWEELDGLLSQHPGYLGIDSSIAPLYSGSSSFVHLIKQLGLPFSHSVTTDIYARTSAFIKTHNPHPIGLCGLMFPCMEDFELAEEYEVGNFSIERNIFLSLHSGLGIDTYPIAIDQDKSRIVEIARLVQQLSNRYKKPLSIRFVCDGKAKIGEKTNFQNQYLKDVRVRAL